MGGEVCLRASDVGVKPLRVSALITPELAK